jgi:hypothetical protein
MPTPNVDYDTIPPAEQWQVAVASERSVSAGKLARWEEVGRALYAVWRIEHRLAQPAPDFDLELAKLMADGWGGRPSGGTLYFFGPEAR